MEIARFLGGVAYLVVLLGFASFCLLFHVLADWRASAMGRHIMTFMLVCTAVLTWSLVNYTFKLPPLLQAIGRVALFLSLGGVVWWRVKLLIDAQIAGRQGGDRDSASQFMEGKRQDA